jgi:predicted small lipoprotein YifL
MQGLLQVDDDLAAIRKTERDHPPDALVVDVRIRLVVDAITASFDAAQQRFGSIHEFGVGHYNFTMLNVLQILVSGPCMRFALAASVVGALAGCGQKGPLYLPTGEAAAARATLPETLIPARPAQPASAPPATGTASPIRAQ